MNWHESSILVVLVNEKWREWRYGCVSGALYILIRTRVLPSILRILLTLQFRRAIALQMNLICALYCLTLVPAVKHYFTRIDYFYCRFYFLYCYGLEAVFICY